MKTSLYLLFFLSIFGISCCNDDDDTTAETQPIAGEWNLKHAQGGLAGVNDTYEDGIIVWTFSDDGTTLVVENNNTEDAIYDGLESGTYACTYLSTDGTTTSLIIDETLDLGILTINGSTMTLDENVAADGFLLTFER